MQPENGERARDVPPPLRQAPTEEPLPSSCGKRLPPPSCSASCSSAPSGSPYSTVVLWLFRRRWSRRRPACGAGPRCVEAAQHRPTCWIQHRWVHHNPWQQAPLLLGSNWQRPASTRLTDARSGHRRRRLRLPLCRRHCCGSLRKGRIVGGAAQAIAGCKALQTAHGRAGRVAQPPETCAVACQLFRAINGSALHSDTCGKGAQAQAWARGRSAPRVVLQQAAQ